MTGSPEPVVELNEYWAVYETGEGLAVLPRQPIPCPVCGYPMLLHDFTCYTHTAYKPPLAHCDVHLKCHSCGLFLTFGLPTRPETVERLRKSRLHGRPLRWELARLYRDNRVEERLERMGYW